MKKIIETLFSVKNRIVLNQKEKILTILGVRILLSSNIYIYNPINHDKIEEQNPVSSQEEISPQEECFTQKDNFLQEKNSARLIPSFSSAQEVLEKYKDSPIKLHIGCGNVYKEGWINIDNNEYNDIKKLDLELDLVNPLPFPDNSVDFIFNEHFLEHLTVDEGKRAVSEFMRVLKPQGVLRIAMPSLKTSIAHYTKSREQWLADTKELFEKFHLTYIKTQAEHLNIAFREWGHKWLYDEEELVRRIEELGFKNYVFCELHKSVHAPLNNLETRNESILIVEITKGE